MAKELMPTTEAEPVVDTDERVNYELAFHILPTVAEGEVPDVFDTVKKVIVDADGSVTDEEAAGRFELAYEIVKHLEGKNRTFTSAYFGWIRFTAAPAAAIEISHTMEARTDILRHLLIRLTRAEEAHPFRFHDALSSQKQVTNIEETDTSDVSTVEDTENADDGASKEEDSEGSTEDTEETKKDEA